MSAVRPRYQFYGRRKGKPLRRHHLELMQNLLPKLSINLENPLQGTQPRRWLEIGFGGGEHMTHQAALHPELTIIGAEAFQNGVAKALAQIEEKALTNVRLHYGDARFLLDALPDQSLDRIYLLYPDPWPKERQKRRRFINPENLAKLHRVLRRGAQLYFASDIADYVDWTLMHVAHHGGFVGVSDTQTPFENWLPTRYEAKARRDGRVSRYLIFGRL